MPARVSHWGRLAWKGGVRSPFPFANSGKRRDVQRELQRREPHMKKLTLTAAALLAAMMTYQPSFAQERTPAPRPEPAGAGAQPGAAAQPAAGREGRDRTSPD